MRLLDGRVSNPPWSGRVKVKWFVPVSGVEPVPPFILLPRSSFAVQFEGEFQPKEADRTRRKKSEDLLLVRKRQLRSESSF